MQTKKIRCMGVKRYVLQCQQCAKLPRSAEEEDEDCVWLDTAKVAEEWCRFFKSKDAV